MFGNLLRTLFTLVCAASLVLCLGAWVVWVRSDHRGRDRLTFRTPVGRYTLLSRDDRIVLLGPPPRGSETGAAKAREIARDLRNEDIIWQAHWQTDASWNTQFGYVHPMWNGQAALASSGTHPRPEELIRPLLKALDDADKFAAAHVLMTQHLSNYNSGVWRPQRLVTSERRSDDVLLANINGLIVELPPGSTVRVDTRVWPGPGPAPAKPVIDPAQLPAIRAHWHQWFGRQQVEADSFSPMWLAYGGLVLPIVWCWPRLRRVLRKRPGCCPECGYDLRASTGRCPECGASTSGAAPPPSGTVQTDVAHGAGSGGSIVPS